MALSKRFLGLGFTFSATDKGLEKKLKAVQSSLEGIDTALKSISGNASSASSGLGSIKVKSPRAEPQFKRGPDLKEKLSAKPKSPFTQEEPSKKFRVDELGKGSKRLEKLFLLWGKKIFKNNSDMFKAFYENVRDLRVELNENGDIATKDLKKLRRIAQVLEKIRKVDESLLFRTRLKLFFTEDIPKYLKTVKTALSDLGGSVERFFSSIGLDIRAMVPEQIRALAGIAKSLANVVNQSVIKPLMGLGKKIFDMTGIPNLLKSVFSKDSEKEKLQQELKELRDTIGGSGQKTTNSLLYKIYKQLAADKKEEMSLLSKMIIGGLAVVAGIVAGLFSEAKKVFSDIPRAFSFVSKALRGVAGLFKRMNLPRVAKGFEKLAMGSSYLRDTFIGIQMALANFKAAISRISQSVKARFDRVMATIEYFFSGVKTKILNFGKSFPKISQFIAETFSKGSKYIAELGPKIAAKLSKITPFFTKLLSFGGAIGKKLFWPLILLDVFRGFSKAFEEESNFFVALLKGLVYAIDNFLLNIPSFLLDKAKGIFGSETPKVITPEGYTPPVIPTPLLKGQDMSQLNSSSLKQTELLQKQVQEQQKNNDLMMQMIDAILQGKDQKSGQTRAERTKAFQSLFVAAGGASPE